MSWDSIDQALGSLKGRDHKFWSNYLGFYSSWLGGYFREPWAMSLPLDDHGFHRGDGVFEAARIHNRAFIDLGPHLERLERSAKSIGMTLPKTKDEIRDICVELGRRANVETGILRLYVTRGPGGFSPAPAEVIGHQIYAAITVLQPPRPEQYIEGVRAMLSTVDAKDPFWSQIKSCNYLQNVMMKKECAEKGYDYAISAHKDGRLCEGATENILIVKRGEVLVPKFDYTLRGTTVLEVMRIAETYPQIKSVRLADLGKDDLFDCDEAAFVGTTLGVLPISSLDGRPIGRSSGVVGRLNADLKSRMASDPRLRTEF